MVMVLQCEALLAKMKLDSNRNVHPGLQQYEASGEA